jgi:hypothetical protein
MNFYTLFIFEYLDLDEKHTDQTKRDQSRDIKTVLNLIRLETRKVYP